MDLPFQCLEPSFSCLWFSVFPLLCVTVLYSDQELFWLHHQQIAMPIVVLPLYLSDCKSLLIGNCKRNLEPSELSVRAEPRRPLGCRHLLTPLLLTTESLTLPSNWSFVSSFSTSSPKQYSFAQWTLSTSSGPYPQPEERWSRWGADAVISSYDVCCQKQNQTQTCECWSRGHGSEWLALL